MKKVKYVLFDKNKCEWQLVYCNSHKPEGETAEEIAKSIIDRQFVGKFSVENYVCANGKGIKSDPDRIFILNENSNEYIWQIGGKVSDMNGFIVPNLYYARIIGLIV